MKVQPVLIALTVANIGLLTFSLVRPSEAGTEQEAPVLRGHALEIVDDQGRVRASIAVIPADPTVTLPDGTRGYPETVLLRLRTSEGHPNVKLEANEQGAGLLLGGESNPTYIQALARRGSTSLTLKNQDGRQRRLKP